MSSHIKADLSTIANALENANPGVFLREAAKTALGRVKEFIAFDRTQREFLAADLVALAEGTPVKLNLSAAVEARIAGLESDLKTYRDDARFIKAAAEPPSEEQLDALASAGAYR